MTREEVYRGVRGAMFLYGGLFKKLIEEVGVGEALAIHAKLQKPYGDGWARLLKDKQDDSEFNIDMFSDVYVKMSNSGVENVYEVGSDSFMVLGYQCPVYDGLMDAGINHDIIKSMCEDAFRSIISALRRHYPIVEGDIVFRNNSQGYCVECYKLKSNQ